MFGLSGSSVKENNKANRLVTPKSPSRKIKTRSSKTALTTPNFNELNEKNKPEKLKSEPRGRAGSETITSTADSKPLTGQQLQAAALSIQKGSAGETERAVAGRLEWGFGGCLEGRKWVGPGGWSEEMDGRLEGPVGQEDTEPVR